MKNLIIVFLAAVMVFLLCIGINISGGSSKINNEELIRLHIRANSNSLEDQSIKYEIKNIVVDYFTPLLAYSESKEDVERIIKDNEKVVEEKVDIHLEKNNFDYKSNLHLTSEYFPIREYDGYVVEEGYYDALIIELGDHSGDNWWCVMYPPLCFTNSKNIVYKSKIEEIINQFF